MSFTFLIFLISGYLSASVELSEISVSHEAKKGQISPQSLNSALRSSDTAGLLDSVPGVSLRDSGGISSLPSIHGMSNDRVNIRVDDVEITSACPNHMNTPLSHINPDKVDVIEVISGLTPVSLGGDSIGGSVIVKSKSPQFSLDEKLLKKISASTFYKSNNQNIGATLEASVANKRWSFSYEGIDEKASRYQDGNGDELKGTLYNQNNHALSVALNHHGDIFSIKLKRVTIPYQGHINQYMDMNNNRADAIHMAYSGSLGIFEVETTLSFQHTDHYMNKITSERSGNMPMFTSSDELGYSLRFSTPLSSSHTLKFGGEYRQFRLEDWWTPVDGSPAMSPHTFNSIHLGRRDRLGLYVENISQWSSTLSTLLGIRTDIVMMNAGEVQGYNSTNNLPADALDFNNKKRDKKDHNLDLTLSLDKKVGSQNNLEVGYARKSRSPNLYERYAWAGRITNTTGPSRMDMRMINWFGDGNGYTGDIDLVPEVSHMLSSSWRYKDDKKRWSFSATAFASYIENFIDADILSADAQGRNYLVFANHDTHLLGLNFTTEMSIAKNQKYGDLNLKLIGDYTRGYRIDGKADLYHLMPLNSRLTFEHVYKNWANQLTVSLVDKKSRINSLRNEIQTPGYALFDISSSFQVDPTLKIDLAVTNLLDHAYSLPLGGVDLVNHDNFSTNVLGMGRSYNFALRKDF